MKRSRKTFVETIAAIAALGFLFIVWTLIIQVAVIAVSIFIGLFVTAIEGWQTGALAGILGYFVIMKILWYIDIFNMLPIGRGPVIRKRDTGNNRAPTVEPTNQ
jgi:uncharacterized membrane protein